MHRAATRKGLAMLQQFRWHSDRRPLAQWLRIPIPLPFPGTGKGGGAVFRSVLDFIGNLGFRYRNRFRSRGFRLGYGFFLLLRVHRGSFTGTAATGLWRRFGRSRAPRPRRVALPPLLFPRRMASSTGTAASVISSGSLASINSTSWVASTITARGASMTGISSAALGACVNIPGATPRCT